MEKTQGLYTSRPRPWGKTTKDTMTYNIEYLYINFMQTMLKWRQEREFQRDRQTGRQRQGLRETDRQTDTERGCV